MKRASVRESAGGFDHNATCGATVERRRCPPAAGLARRVRREIPVGPFDRVTDMRIDACRHELKAVNIDMDGPWRRRGPGGRGVSPDRQHQHEEASLDPCYHCPVLLV